uniref:Ig-like domain-containing protein n=1 Tax=Oncorhynchus kisutch TaxID=8019 RepID=A0A8C7H4X9_ONCKI
MRKKHLLKRFSLLYLFSVSMVLTFKQVYSGDTIILSCDKSTGKVKWFFNKVEDQNQANKTWSIRAVSAKNSGSYQCENNGQKSDNFNITVLEYLPPATLLIKSGEPVINIDGSVVLELLVEEDKSLKGWCCWVYKAGRVRRITLKKSLTTENHKVMSASNDNPILSDPSHFATMPFFLFLSSTFPVSISPPDQVVRMIILPGPALLGEKLSLRCVVSGTDRISHTIFYKDKQTIKDGSSSSHVIDNVTESDQGIYSCQATFTRSDKRMPNTFNSTQQELIVSAPPMKAVVSESAGLSCSCSSCPNGALYHWYYKQHNPQWLPKGIRESYTGFMPAGSYACRAVWKNGRSALSNIHHYDVDAQETHVLLITIGLIVLGVMLVIGAIVMYRKRRTREGKPTTGILNAFLCAHTYMFV